MKRTSVAGLCVLCMGLFGCGGSDTARTSDAANAAAGVRPATVSETGCLTASGDKFVLTDLESGAGDATTETFQLIGDDAELRKHVGQQVRVNGDADAPKVAVMKESTPAQSQQPAASPQAPAGTTGAGEPKVTAETQTRVEVRQLRVSSIQPTGSSCAAETKTGADQKPKQ